MDIKLKLKKEFESLAWATLYFSVWLGALLLVKTLLLAEYNIEFSDWSIIFMGVLVLAKVVLVFERIPLGTRMQPAWFDVLLRTLLYVAGVFLVLLLEKGFEGRHEHGGFGAALKMALVETNRFHLWVNTFCISAALLGYNVLAVIRRHLGKGGLLRLFIAPLPTEETAQELTQHSGH